MLSRLYYGDIAELKRRRGICSRTKLDKAAMGLLLEKGRGGIDQADKQNQNNTTMNFSPTHPEPD